VSASAGHATLKVTGTGFLADPETEAFMQDLLSAAAVFCSEPANFPRFRRFILGYATGPAAEALAAIEPEFLGLVSMALSPDGLHA
jgi:hypothetical protein